MAAKPQNIAPETSAAPQEETSSAAEQPQPKVVNAPPKTAREIELEKQLAAKDAMLLRAGIADNLDDEVAWRVRAGLSLEDAMKVARRNQATKDAMKLKDPTERQAALVAAAGL